MRAKYNDAYLVTVMTVPGSLVLSDPLETDHTLCLTLDQLNGQPTAKVGFSEQGQLALISSLKICRVNVNLSFVIVGKKIKLKLTITLLKRSNIVLNDCKLLRTLSVSE